MEEVINAFRKILKGGSGTNIVPVSSRNLKDQQWIVNPKRLILTKTIRISNFLLPTSSLDKTNFKLKAENILKQLRLVTSRNISI